MTKATAIVVGAELGLGAALCRGFAEGGFHILVAGIDAIAEAYWQIHCEPRSAWTHEIDLRPFKESF